ncbi:MAG: PIN domain-containing protein [Chthoniobacteraceae bacterium]|jgi:predicted nucleic-acid-binding protein
MKSGTASWARPWNGFTRADMAAKSLLVAVDTNVLLDQALADEDVLDALQIIRERMSSTRFIVTPTVLEELGRQADEDPKPAKREAAGRVLDHLIEWGYEPLNVIPVGKGIVEQISFKLRSRGVIPDEEENDASLTAEAALLGCGMLLTSDSHLLDAQAHPKFREILKSCSVDGENIVIAKPRAIVTRFFKRR